MASNVEVLNRVKYAGLDFNSASDEILSRLQVDFAAAYNDFAISSLGIMLVDLFAFGLDNLAFYLDRRATDNFLSTARTRKSVARAARQLGYKMSPATAASVDLEINPATAQVMIVPLPIGFQVMSPDGSIWEAQQAYSWPVANTTPQTITFSQTKTAQVVFTSDGTANQVFEIGNVPDSEYIVGPGSDGVSQVVVKVNGTEWDEVELLTFGTTNQFEIGYNDSPPTLRFGDGIAGNIPLTGSEISFTFKSSRGPLGSVTSGQVMTPVRPLAVGFTTVNLEISNPLGSSGGTSPETIEKAKASAPTYFKSRGVNITKEDYNVRAGTYSDSVFGSVAVASAVTVRGAASDAVLQSLVSDISVRSDEYQDEVSDFAAVQSSNLSGLSSQLASITESNDAIATECASVSSGASTASDAVLTMTTSAAQVTIFLGQIMTAITALETALAGITMLSSQADTLAGLVGSIQASYTNANTQISNISVELSTIGTALNEVSESADEILVESTSIGGQLLTAGTNVTAISTGVSSLQETIGSINNDIDDIALQIIDHVDSFLASDCQANLIEVPILALDGDGFYAAPTIALIKSLQSYLESKKEVTQVVKVVSGASLLVLADLSVNIGVRPGYVESTIKSQVEAAILNVLKRRPFGKSLRLSELYWVTEPARAAIDGVDFIDVKITGPSTLLDGNGDLEVAENQIVTKGTITITTEISIPVVGA